MRPVVRMRLLPFLLAGPHILGVGGISADSFAVIVAAPAALAIRLAADALLWSITGRLKNLLAVSATPARTHAVLVLLRFKLRTSDQNKTGCRKNIETFVEFLPRLCRWGSQGWFTGSGLYRRNWLRLTPALTDVALKALSREFDWMYSDVGRPSIAPEKLLRALLLQILYTIRSERMLIEQLDYIPVVCRAEYG